VTLVIDASVALSWCFEDERRSETDALGERIIMEGAHVPNLFHLELANIFLHAERRGRLSAADAAPKLDRIRMMPIVVDADTARNAWGDTQLLARAERLTLYDAAYLELALRLRADLATLDSDLAAAARRRGVVTLPG